MKRYPTLTDAGLHRIAQKDYKRPSKLVQKRGPGGQFRRTVLKDFGLGAPVCPECGAFNPYEQYAEDPETGFTVQQPPPETCHDCGAELFPEEPEEEIER